jgi:hypothetical protein
VVATATLSSRRPAGSSARWVACSAAVGADELW